MRLFRVFLPLSFCGGLAILAADEPLRTLDPQAILSLRESAESSCQRSLVLHSSATLREQISAFLASHKFPAAQLAETTERVENLLTKSGLFTERFIATAILSLWADISWKVDKESVPALLKDMSLSEKPGLVMHVLDSIAGLLLLAEKKNSTDFAKLLGIKEKELTPYIFYWKDYRRDDPALFYAEIALRFALETLYAPFLNSFYQRSLIGTRDVYAVSYSVRFSSKDGGITETSLLERLLPNERLMTNDRGVNWIFSQVHVKAWNRQGEMNYVVGDLASDDPFRQYLLVRYNELFSLDELRAALGTEPRSWAPALRDYLLKEIQRLEVLAAPLVDAHKAVEAAKQTKNLQQELIDKIRERLKELEDHLVSLEQAKSASDYPANISVGFADPTKLAGESALKSVIHEIDKRIAQVREEMVAQHPGIPTRTAVVPPHILAKAGPFYGFTLRKLIEHDSAAATNRNSPRENYFYYYPANILFHEIQSYVRENATQIHPDDFLAGMSLLLSTIISEHMNYLNNRAIAWEVFLRGIVQEIPLSRAEFRRVANVIEYHVRYRLNPDPEAFVKEKEWWNRRSGDYSGPTPSTDLSLYRGQKLADLEKRDRALSEERSQALAKLRDFRLKALAEAADIFRAELEKLREELTGEKATLARRMEELSKALDHFGQVKEEAKARGTLR
jgi:hypothetical protein